MADHINLVKLCVGAEKVDDLLAWQSSPRAKGPDGRVCHVTRMWPRREAELLAGGSIYWVFKGVILARQRVLDLQRVDGGDGIVRCAIVLDDTVVRTRPATRRPFQGWRYLTPQDAPADLPAGRAADDALPREMETALADLGLL
ncbi:DUF1489 family protein [Meridianimarinicoccus sp. RP-17]|uniref:DUF1489 family protein n=1 Tax=Meridianimarinicoccus zhengii TaxID=2056810 RepID=UPI000DAB8F5D|nr:DUF1489 domain-containing protein [Phycocomes zhengii]